MIFYESLFNIALKFAMEMRVFVAFDCVLFTFFPHAGAGGGGGLGCVHGTPYFKFPLQLPSGQCQ